MSYTGAMDECSPCFVNGVIQKFDENGDCPTHKKIMEESGYKQCNKCGTVHHYSYRHCDGLLSKEGEISAAL